MLSANCLIALNPAVPLFDLLVEFLLFGGKDGLDDALEFVFPGVLLVDDGA